jgi:hypothetical protein
MSVLRHIRGRTYLTLLVAVESGPNGTIDYPLRVQDRSNRLEEISKHEGHEDGDCEDIWRLKDTLAQSLCGKHQLGSQTVQNGGDAPS